MWIQRLTTTNGSHVINMDLNLIGINIPEECMVDLSGQYNAIFVNATTRENGCHL